MISTSFRLDVVKAMRLDHLNPFASGRRTRGGGPFVRISLAAAVFLFMLLLIALSPSNAGENLKINPKLDYTSDISTAR